MRPGSANAPHGWVAVGRYRPTAPTDPDVRTLAHPVPRPTGSPSAMVPVAIQSSYVDMLIEPRCVRHVALDQVCRPTLRFPPQGPLGRVPLLQQYYQSATTPCCHPAALRFLRLAVPRLHSLVSLPSGRVHPPRPGVGNPVSPAGNSPRSEQGSPKFLGNHDCPFAHVPIRRRQDCLHQTIAVQQRGPWSS
jgi:hypothetical protein